MIIEDRADDGWPVYDLLCQSCGQMFGYRQMGSGLELAREAHIDKWDCICGIWYCPDDSPGRWAGPEIDVTMPRDFKQPDVRCGECGTITARRSGKCRKCGKELANG